MKQYGLNREMTQTRQIWKEKLSELFPKHTEEAEAEHPGEEKEIAPAK